jgi:hypothetical protein
MHRWLTAILLAATQAAVVCGCSGSPAPSHVDGAYRGKLPDDTLVEAATTVLVTKRDVVVAIDCAELRGAIAAGDSAAIDRAVGVGYAARLPARVTLYTPPFSAANPQSAPTVVTDDKYGGKLCTPNSYDVVKQ